MDMNYADVAMYAYANQSFWDRISTEGPDFYAEVKRLKDAKADVLEQCKGATAVVPPYAMAVPLESGTLCS